MMDTELSSDSHSSTENSNSESESDTSCSSLDSLDSDFHPENIKKQGSDIDADEEPEDQENNIDKASNTKQGKQLQREPVQGDKFHQHLHLNTRLIMQAESSGKTCFLGPAVGWDEQELLKFLQEADEEIPDKTEIGKPSNSF